VIALAFVAAFASDSWGQSKKPSSSADPPSKQTTQPPASDQRGTDKSPFSVKILPSPEAGQQAEKQERERQEKELIDKKLAFDTQRIADYTWWLASLTGALFAIAVMQAAFFFIQLGIMKKGMDDTASAVQAAKDTATAALLQARAAVGAELAEIVFARFDLVRLPDAPPGQPDRPIPAGLIPQNELRILFHIKNSGRTRSKITELCVEWLLVGRMRDDNNPDPPEEPVYKNRNPMSHIFGIDETIPIKWVAGKSHDIILTNEQREAINTNKTWLWVYGVCRYIDFMNDAYDVGFCAHWEPIAGITIGSTAVPVPRGFVNEGPSAYVYRRKVEKQGS
jgi:hypothetical protein